MQNESVHQCHKILNCTRKSVFIASVIFTLEICFFLLIPNLCIKQCVFDRQNVHVPGHDSGYIKDNSEKKYESVLSRQPIG